MIRKVVKAPGQRDGDPVGRVEAEEPDARIAPRSMDVRPDIRLVEGGEAPDGGQPTGRTPVMVNGTRPT
jgi:hypothetical protein